MKGKRIRAVVTAALLAVCVGFSACACTPASTGGGADGDKKPGYSAEEYYVESIEVFTDDTFKTTYADGEAFDSSGMTVKAVWNDGYIEENVSSSKYYVVPSVITDGTTEVTVHYGDASATVQIGSVQIVGIALLRAPTVTTYFVGETFKIEGLVFGWLLDDGTTRTISDFDLSKAVFDAEREFVSGDKSVRVEYESFAFDVPVTVRGRGVKMEVTDTSEFVVMSTESGDDPKCKMGTNETICALASNGDFMQNFAAGDIMTFTFESDTAQVNLLFQGASTYVTEYGLDNTWAPLIVEDMQVSRIFDMEVNGRSVPISNHAILNGARATDGKEDVKYLANWTEVDLGIVNVYTDRPNVVQLKFKENGYRNQDRDTRLPGTMMPAPYIDYLMIGVVEDDDTVTGIEITTEPTKKEYVEGQEFDASGMTVIATHKDGHKTTLPRTAYNVSPKVLTELGENELTISHAECTDTVTVNVIERIATGIEIASQPTLKEYGIGQSFDPTGMVVVANYNDGSTEVLTDYTYTPNGTLTKDDTLITISALGFTATVTIVVSENEVAESYTVTGVPTDEFAVGEELPEIVASNITVTVNYYSGNTKTLSADEYEVSVPTGAAALGSAVTITLKDDGTVIVRRLIVRSDKIDITMDNSTGGALNYRENVSWAPGAHNNSFMQGCVTGAKITVTVQAASETKAQLILTGASGCVKARAANGLPKIMEDMYASFMFDLYVNNIKVEMNADAKLSGGDYGEGSNNNLAKWCDTVLGEIALKSGDNTIELRFKANYTNHDNSTAAPNLDYLTVLQK